jgi:sulfotransferase family protein
MSARRLPVLFIGGLGRSGSTLVDRVLGQTPGVCSVGELVFIWDRALSANELCGCGQPFNECPFWKEVGVAAFGGWDRIDPVVLRARQLRVDRNRYVPAMFAPSIAPAYRRRLEPYAEVVGRLYQAIADVAGARLIVDSSKHASTATFLRHVPGIDPKIVQLFRDPHGVAWSWSKTVERPDATEGISLMARVGAARIAARWQAYNALLALLRSRGAALRYEDFVDRPEEATRRLLALGGLGPGELPQFVGPRRVALDVDHTVAGNPLRFRTGEIEIRADDQWRRSMPPSRRALVSLLSFPSTVVYRYAP